MKDFTAHFKVTGGRIEWRNPDYMKVNLPKFEGKAGVCVIKVKFNKRSQNQNRWMWLCFDVLAEHTGHTAEEVHTLCKGLYCPRKHVTVGKVTYSLPKGTSELSKGEMVEFMMHVSALAGELGVTLPDPTDLQMPQLSTGQEE